MESLGRTLLYRHLRKRPRSARQHNEGLSRWTARYRPWTLVYTCKFADYTAARKFENELKRHKGGLGFFAATGLSRDNFRPRESGS